MNEQDAGNQAPIGPEVYHFEKSVTLSRFTNVYVLRGTRERREIGSVQFFQPKVGQSISLNPQEARDLAQLLKEAGFSG